MGARHGHLRTRVVRAPRRVKRRNRQRTEEMTVGYLVAGLVVIPPAPDVVTPHEFTGVKAQGVPYFVQYDDF